MNITYLKPAFQIGKSGISEAIVKAIIARLKKKKILKIKFLQAAIKGKNKEELFQKLARMTSARIIKKVGFTLVLRYEGN